MAHVVGLDIGASAVRAVELDVGPSRPVLLRFGQVGLPPGAIVDGEIHDRTAVTDAISRLWRNVGFDTKAVVVGLAGLRAITREIELPHVPDNEVEGAVRFQSEDVIPFPADKTILASQVLADHKAPDGATVRRVLVAAAHRDLVDAVVDVVQGAGLEVAGADLVSSALVRALVDVGGSAADQPEAVVSVGAGLTVVVVHEQGRPQFVRTIGLGGNAATAAVAGALDLPYADAEAVKRRLGEPVPQVHAAEVAVQEPLAELVSEIRSSVQYFSSLPDRAPVAKVSMTGGGARLRGLVEQLRAQLGIPVEVVSALARLDVSQVDATPELLAAIDPVLCAPIGLALPEANPAVRKFNLVPPELVHRAAVRRITRKVTLAAAVVLGLALCVGGLRFYQVHDAEHALGTLDAEIATLNAEKPAYSDALAVADTVRTAESKVRSLTIDVPDWYAVVANLASMNPDQLAVTGFTGTAIAPATTRSSSGSPGTTATTTTATGSTTVPGQIGTVSATVSGTYAGNVNCNPYAAFIGDIGAPMFGTPQSTGPTCPTTNGSTVVTFQTTIPVLSLSSLAKQGCYDPADPVPGCPRATASKVPAGVSPAKAKTTPVKTTPTTTAGAK
ncbi:MAG: type IV pilus assembly protein PilM [Actinomycetota bacterium]|jgi:type IV pilus assembly protein PilM|nr:type IV pilus assembly protein PilM [Actinomycetota bacterium]